MFQVVITELRKDRVFQALHVIICRRLLDKTSKVRGPPVLNSKHYNMLLALGVNVKGFETAGKHETFIAAYISILNDKLSLDVFTYPDFRSKNSFFLISEAYVFI